MYIERLWWQWIPLVNVKLRQYFRGILVLSLLQTFSSQNVAQSLRFFSVICCCSVSTVEHIDLAICEAYRASACRL